jgi:eukaryotic-like serine/threonine-protein kinase
VARMQDSGDATRTQGNMVGTLKYMSPEQVQGQKIDSRADLFSVGVVLYQLLTDKRPFDGDNDFSIIHQIIGHTPPAPSTYNARLPSAIDAVVARALAKDRDQRFATARDFATALQSAIRRAEDQTVVPPADPFKKTDGAGTGSRVNLSVPGTSPSTVTQEVELVYWKDIKDSTDPEELEGFLQKFPAGIYADLARRRLRKLLGGNSSPDSTILSGATSPNPDQDLEATRLLYSSTPPAREPTIAPREPTLPGREPTIPPMAAPAAVDSTQTQTSVTRTLAEPRSAPYESTAPLQSDANAQ